MRLKIDIEKKSYEVTVEFLDGAPRGHHAVESGKVDVPEAVLRPREHLKLMEDRFCRAPITGRVTTLLAVDGQSLRQNEPVLILEAMKMDIKIGPAVDGVLKIIHVKPGEIVKPGQLLFELI